MLPASAAVAAPRSALVFEPNRGQAAEPVRFLAHGAGYSLFITDTELVTVLRRGDLSGWE